MFCGVKGFARSPTAMLIIQQPNGESNGKIQSPAQKFV
jgi:hypothetical protein